MKRCIAATGLALLFVAPASARTRIAQEQREQSLLARVTVYWASGGRGSDSYTRRHKSSTGARLRVGHCAVDPRRIPYGSKVVLTDGVFTAVDTGGAVISRKAARRAGRTASERNALVIDRFFETKRQALSWANTHPAFMTVQVLPPNYSRAETVQLPQPAKQPGAQLARQPVRQLIRHSVPQIVRQPVPQLAMQSVPQPAGQPAPQLARQSPPQVAKQPAPQLAMQPGPKIAAATIPQTRRIAGAKSDAEADQVRR